MKIQLIVVGKTRQDFVLSGVSEFSKRIGHYLPFEIIVVPDIKNSKNMPVEQQKEREAEVLLKHFHPNDHVILLDENGKEYSSVQFAAFLEKTTASAVKNTVFVIGGAYGFAPSVYARAQEKIALSQMTFSHQLVRLIFVEQLYRALTILNNEPYHHE